MTRTILLGVALILGGAPSWAADPAAVSTSTVSRASWNVRDFGGKGDGQSKDTRAVQKALDTCVSAGGGTVVVPSGAFLIGSIVLGSNTTLQLERGANLMGSPDIGDYPLVRVRWEGEFAQGHRALISAEDADHIAIIGRGSVLGPPLSVSQLRNPRGPALIEVAGSTNVVLEGFTTQYQQLWSIHLFNCQNLTARNLTIRSINFNGDGIDVDSCQDVVIEHCHIDTGDDAISLKSGRGMEAVRLGRPTRNVLIKDCTLVSSIFAGLSIGSEMSGGIRDVRLENCIISGRQNGILFKSREGRGGFIENVTGENLTIHDSPTFLAIDLLKRGIQASEPVPGAVDKWAHVHDISFNNIKVNNVAELVTAKNVPPERPVDGLSLVNISGTCGKGITLANVVNAKLAGISVTGFQGPLLTTSNVTGVGLEQAQGSTSLPPDVIVAADGSGNFRTVAEAVAAVPTGRNERIIIFLKDGVYREKIRVDANCVTLRGQSRTGTRLEYAQLDDDFNRQPDPIGRAVVNVEGNDFVLENLTVANTDGHIGPHAFAVSGRGDRTVIVDCDVLSAGADTLALGRGAGGRYYQARCNFRGSVDFICPRGWCYMTDCMFYEVNSQAHASIWHDGSRDKDMKFVLRHCSFDGAGNWILARHHHDAQFLLLDCRFSKTMTNLAPYRVVYPIAGDPPKESDAKRNHDLDASNLWGERAYYHNCHREGGDYDWFADNLSSAPNSPAPDQVTAAWTFAGRWDPERRSGPGIHKVIQHDDRIEVIFSESVTAKGKPRLVLKSGRFADYMSGSGSDTLVFGIASGSQRDVASVDPNGGAIVASEATATLRLADVSLR